MAFIDVTKTGQDKYVGFEITLADYIADHLGLELILMPMAYADCDDAVSNGIVDLAIASFAWTEERAISFNLSNLYHTTSAGGETGEGSLILLQKGADSLTKAVNKALSESTQYWDTWYADAFQLLQKN